MIRVVAQPIIVLICIVFISANGNCQDDYVGKLREARTKFEEAQNEFSAGVEKWLDGIEDRARKRGDRNAVSETAKVRVEFKKTGIAPKDAPTVLRKKFDAAASRLRKDYDVVIRDLTRQREDKKAADVSKELEQLLDSASRVEWQPIFANGVLDPQVSKDDFLVENGLLTAYGDQDKLFLFMRPLKNFRVRLKYRLDEKAEAMLILRCPNARKSREVGYCVGLGSTQGGVWNINRAYNFVFMSGATKLIADFNSLPSRGVVPPGEFHMLEVIAIDSRFRIILDGRPLYEFSDTSHKEGVLGLQNKHSKMEIESFEYASLP